MGNNLGEKLIEIKDLRKNYLLGKVTTEVLRGMDVEINQGEFVSIMGASGAGKSTFMNILGFLDVPSKGNYKFEGTNTEKFTDDDLAEIRNKKVGFVFQMFNLLPQLSALENVMLPLTYANVSEKEQIERAHEVLKSVNIDHRSHHKPPEMSGGEQQRVAIARALINNPKIILADEPTGNLDSKTSYEIMELFCDLHYNKHYTVIMVTHEPDIAEYSERLLFLRDGKIEKDKDQKKCGLVRYGLRNGKEKLMKNGNGGNGKNSAKKSKKSK